MFFLYGNVEFIDIIMFSLQIEKLLLRNQSPHKVVTEQAYRLQQGLLLTSTQQQVRQTKIVLQFEVKSLPVKIYDRLKFAVSL